MACVNQQRSSLETFVTPSGGEVLNLTFDCSQMREISCYGQTLLAAVFEVLENNVSSMDFLVSGVFIDSTKTKINFTLTNLSAVPPTTYQLVCTMTFSGGNVKKANLDVEVENPIGGQVVPCGCN